MTGSRPAATTATSTSRTATPGPSPASTPTAASPCEAAAATGPCPLRTCDAHVELAYATTVHGAQGETVDHAHLLVGETTGAAAAYVGMTRGRHANTAHLVAETIDEARAQWIATFSRDRADLGPAPRRAESPPTTSTATGPRPHPAAPSTTYARDRAHAGVSVDERPPPPTTSPRGGIGR